MGKATFSTTSGFVREWLKLFRGSIGLISFPFGTSDDLPTAK
jgi:hypothetical protein